MICVCAALEEPEIFERSMRLNYMGTVHAIKAIASLHVTCMSRIQTDSESNEFDVVKRKSMLKSPM